MATPKQVALLKFRLYDAGYRTEVKMLDFLYGLGIDVDSLEQLSHKEVVLVLEELSKCERERN